MMSDAAFLNEVDGFLASCELPVLPSTRKQRKIHATSPQKNADGEKKTSKKQGTSKDKSYYRRRKKERFNLRRQMTELAVELEQLQKHKKANKTPPLSKWKALAKYQAEKRANAEFEQRQLSAAIDTRAAQLLDFFKLAQAELSQLGVAEQEIRLVDGASSGPFKRIRVDPPLDNKAEFYLSELDGAINKSSSGGESDTEFQ
ncbi:hypothetical protein V7S43_009949 [Phytophthora oleae]|uniref:BZIP domain-containing protein n=1 Tax=Phytophthora oleae TaxID=2107226 RepID=A0ABD3FEN2_9STRA